MQNTLKSHNTKSTATTFIGSEWKRKYTNTSTPCQRERCRGSVQVCLIHYYLISTGFCTGQMLMATTFTTSLFSWIFLKKNWIPLTFRVCPLKCQVSAVAISLFNLHTHCKICSPFWTQIMYTKWDIIVLFDC